MPISFVRQISHKRHKRECHLLVYDVCHFCQIMKFVVFDVCRLRTFVCQDVCRLILFVAYDVCRIMTVVANYDVLSLIVFVAVPIALYI